MVSIMSRCPMKSCQSIIREALPTNRAKRDRPACTAQVRTAIHFLAFASTSTSSTQGSRLSFKSRGKSSNSPIKCGLKTSHTMKQISIWAGLSKTTNHCVRAMAITLWSDWCVPARHIMSISGHANEQSLASYNRLSSTSQLKNCSDILYHALQKGRAPAQTATAVAFFSNSSSSAVTSTAVAKIPANSSIQGIFNSCNIGQAQVFILSQNASNSTFQ